MLQATSRILCLVLLFGIAAAEARAQIDPTSPHIGPHVRGATPAITALITRGIKRSPTFAALVAALNQTDVIVYIERTRSLPSGVDGQLAFSGAAGPLRYLRAQVIIDLEDDAMLAIAGHELQHALEVAAYPEVRDMASLGSLYERIGIGMSRKGRFDTAAAQQAGRKVRSELS
ncbi:MAG: hypothetical protein ABIS06_17065 [Vicinamibacterales bacterium]